MKKRLFFTAGVIGMFIVGTMACAGPSRLEMDYGTSAKLAKFNQILNPDAGKNLEPVEGLDGVAANAVMEKYRKEFEKAPSPSTNVYMLTGSTGAK
jgi:hypothetical protein